MRSLANFTFPSLRRYAMLDFVRHNLSFEHSTLIRGWGIGVRGTFFFSFMISRSTEKYARNCEAFPTLLSTVVVCFLSFLCVCGLYYVSFVHTSVCTARSCFGYDLSKPLFLGFRECFLCASCTLNFSPVWFVWTLCERFVDVLRALLWVSWCFVFESLALHNTSYVHVLPVCFVWALQISASGWEVYMT